MPTGSPPESLHEFLLKPNPCVVATVTLTGELHTAPTWYEWIGDGTVLLNMDGSRLRLKHLRQDPRVGLTIIDADDWYKHVSLIGHVTEIRHDPELVEIDRQARIFTGGDYPSRTRDSWTAVVHIDRWHGRDRGTNLT